MRKVAFGVIIALGVVLVIGNVANASLLPTFQPVTNITNGLLPDGTTNRVNGSTTGSGTSGSPYGDPTLSTIVSQDMYWQANGIWRTADLVITLTRGFMYTARGATGQSVANLQYTSQQDPDTLEWSTWMSSSGPDYTAKASANGKTYLNAPQEFTTWVCGGSKPTSADAANGVFYPYGKPAFVAGGASAITGDGTLVWPAGFYQRMNSTTVNNTLPTNQNMSIAWGAVAGDNDQTGNIMLGRFSFSNDAVGTFKLVLKETVNGGTVQTFDGTQTIGNINNGVMSYVPEPATMSVLLVGAVGMFLRRRRA